MNPFFSIIVPVYNVKNYLNRCIQSLLDQKMSGLELILVDDGSTDGSGEMCDSFAEQFPQICVIHKENGGLASARNAGMQRACGSYISFVDSDDWLDPGTCRILQEHLQKDTPDILNFGYRKIRNGEVLLQEYAAFPEGLYDTRQIRSLILPDSIAREKAFDQVNLPVQLSACMCVYRRGFLQEHGISFTSEREVLCEDWLFNIRCLCRAHSMSILHDVFYNYDTRDTSLSMSYKPDAYVRRRRLYACYREELDQTGNMTPQIQRRLENFWMESIYCCYLIECCSPSWDRAVRRRMDCLCRDPLYLEYSAKLRPGTCTPKGILFYIITRLRSHFAFCLLYRLAKRRG